ncbi:hypothetical protein AB4072_05760 [Microvirga sp. 2MCAF38]|uniref:hypothetical protein n=1 Tax=Microvirga sp. 2MCAF38 TaxID=3232989 RepID=UPI003F9DDB5A
MASLSEAYLNTGDAAGDSYSAIEGLSGSAYVDRLSGDENANILIGNAGNDTLNGGAGNDVLNGRAVLRCGWDGASGAGQVRGSECGSVPDGGNHHCEGLCPAIRRRLVLIPLAGFSVLIQGKGPSMPLAHL